MRENQTSHERKLNKIKALSLIQDFHFLLKLENDPSYPSYHILTNF